MHVSSILRRTLPLLVAISVQVVQEGNTEPLELWNRTFIGAPGASPLGIATNGNGSGIYVLYRESLIDGDSAKSVLTVTGRSGDSLHTTQAPAWAEKINGFGSFHLSGIDPQTPNRLNVMRLGGETASYALPHNSQFFELIDPWWGYQDGAILGYDLEERRPFVFRFSPPQLEWYRQIESESAIKACDIGWSHENDGFVVAANVDTQGVNQIVVSKIGCEAGDVEWQNYYGAEGDSVLKLLEYYSARTGLFVSTTDDQYKIIYLADGGDFDEQSEPFDLEYHPSDAIYEYPSESLIVVGDDGRNCWISKVSPEGRVMWDTSYADVYPRGTARVWPAQGSWKAVFCMESRNALDSTLTDIRVIRYDTAPEAVEDEVDPPDSHLLLSAFPNPFNSSTTISFSLPSASASASLRVFGLDGRLVKELWTGGDAYPTSERQAGRLSYAGEHKVIWDASGLAAGVYIVRLQADNRAVSQKVVLMR